ncbi:cation diffusion facilitator family transporter [Cellulomonas fimi]|uniref:Cation transporter n=1 Tax=Cellulomonas fimi TaxID=1708 RepID=A0A7Y0M135_CELFI|nr:cation diffusion facilitator family transporter [Cellulomonas fimi]NMR21575.1 cation transporter [Cellulomonas fimi]
MNPPGPHDHHDDAHEHGHDHPAGIRGWLREVFVPHSHDAADSIDDALEASTQGIRTVKISLVVLGATAVAQLAVVAISGSVALLADTIHNFSDAMTAVPLWIAFVLGRRVPTRRYTHGYGRAEDLAGLFIVAMIALSAVVAGGESIRRLAQPQPLDNLGWVLAAGLVGFAGNEAVAVYRIRTGRRIGSAALVADGLHARTDGFTSLAVVLGVLGVWAGFPLADPIVGLLITVAIVILLWGTARDVGRRILDGVDPDLVDRAEHCLEQVDGVHAVTHLRLRWSGHRLNVQAALAADPSTTVAETETLVAQADHQLRRSLPNLGSVDLTVISSSPHRT